jgi:hypothetical protein
MSRKTLLPLLCLALCAWLAAPAAALAAPDDFDQGVNQAREGLKAQDPAKALSGLRQAVAAAWARLPFSVLEVHLVAAPPTAYGQYIERVDNVYRPSEPLILYLEPVGFKVRYDSKAEVYSHNLSADFNLVDAWGRVVAGRRDFGRFAEQSRHFPDRYHLVFTYSLNGLSPGEYRVETTIRDVTGQQTATVVTPFKVEGL